VLQGKGCLTVSTDGDNDDRVKVDKCIDPLPSEQTFVHGQHGNISPVNQPGKCFAWTTLNPDLASSHHASAPLELLPCSFDSSTGLADPYQLFNWGGFPNDWGGPDQGNWYSPTRPWGNGSQVCLYVDRRSISPRVGVCDFGDLQDVFLKAPVHWDINPYTD